LDAGLKRKLKTALVLAFIAALLGIFIHPDYRQGEPSLHGKPAKDFALVLNGKPMRLSNLRGQVVVLNFWATWCPPCVEEAPALDKLQRRIGPRGGIVLGVSLDDDPKAYDDFIQANGITYPTYRDPTKQIAAEYGTSMYPETYIIDRNGRVDRKIIGSQDWTSSEMMDHLNSVLNER
jgi:cytochrome c biogenesis protein CcmG/thiol:disulfide interchange protein DsbE